MKRIFAVVSFFALTVSLATAQRLPEIARPDNYKLTFTPDLDKATFEGTETISIHVLKPTSEITLNAADIDFHEVTITSGGVAQKAKVGPEKEKEMVVLSVEKTLFRVHRTTLCTHSEIFADMFSLPQPPGQDMIEECPVVRLSDRACDFEHLLKALYNPL